jgi:hypothetical protein
MRTFEEFVNESSGMRFKPNKYYIIFDWYIHDEIIPSVVNIEFSSEDEAEKNIIGWKSILSSRMNHNASRIEARNTLDSFIIVNGGYLNDTNKYYKFYDSVD